MPGIWHHGCCCVNDPTITECPEDCAGCASELTIGHTGAFQIIFECELGGALIDVTSLFEPWYVDNYVAPRVGDQCFWNFFSQGSIDPVSFSACPFPAEQEVDSVIVATSLTCDGISGFPNIRWQATRTIRLDGSFGFIWITIHNRIPASGNCPSLGTYPLTAVGTSHMNPGMTNGGFIRSDLSTFGNLTVSL